MTCKDHWETVYGTKATDSVSWYREHLDTSLALIQRATPDSSAAILDVGGGASTLVDDLLTRGYRDISVLDISAEALGVAQRRLGEVASTVKWFAEDLLNAPLTATRYDLWHDRAVFHFLTEEAQRAAYIRQLSRALKPSAYAILATFGPDGPLRCSGLDTVRYDAESLASVLGGEFTLMESSLEWHATPAGSSQQFLYTLFQRATLMPAKEENDGDGQ